MPHFTVWVQLRDNDTELRRRYMLQSPLFFQLIIYNILSIRDTGKLREKDASEDC